MEIKKKKKSSNILLDNQTQKIWCFLENLSRDGRLICDQFVANKSPKISAYVIMESLHARMYPVLFSLSLSLSFFSRFRREHEKLRKRGNEPRSVEILKLMSKLIR